MVLQSKGSSCLPTSVKKFFRNESLSLPTQCGGIYCYASRTEGLKNKMYIPVLISELKTYSRAKALDDLLAGLTVGIVALPLAMAFSIACGLPPERGLFTAIVAGFLVSALGGNKVQIGGPTGAFVVIVAAIVQQYGYQGLVACTLLAGIFLILFGIFRLGGLIKYIPFPVITGFTTGIAVVIFSSQVKNLLGLPVSSIPSEFHRKWLVYLQNVHSFHAPALLISVICIVTIIGIRRFVPRLPAMLIGMLAATAVACCFHMDVETIGSRFGDLPRVLPAPSFPELSFAGAADLIKPAFTIALLASIESLLSATVADGMIGSRTKPNAELLGQGVANIASAVFGGIPATGAIARTATNVKAGAKTPVAGMVHALTLAIILLALAPWANYIPLAALAGILVVVSFDMSELHHFLAILKGPRSDAVVLLLTFAITVLVDLTLAVQIGVILSALLFIRRMAEISNVGMITRELRGDENGIDDPNATYLRDVPHDVEVFEVYGPFFFGMIDTFQNALRQLERPVPVLIVRMRNVLAMDATGIHTLRELLHNMRKKNTHLILSGVHSQPLLSMESSGLLAEIGMENLCGNIDDALNRARTLLNLPHVPRPVPFVPTVRREAIQPNSDSE
jgi:SulP family sulfate permease